MYFIVTKDVAKIGIFSDNKDFLFLFLFLYRLA